MQGAATACRMRQIAKEGNDWEEAPPPPPLPIPRLIFSPEWKRCSSGLLDGREVRWGVTGQSRQVGSYPLGSKGDLLGSHPTGMPLMSYTPTRHHRRETQDPGREACSSCRVLAVPSTDRALHCGCWQRRSVFRVQGEEWNWSLRGSLNWNTQYSLH